MPTSPHASALARHQKAVAMAEWAAVVFELDNRVALHVATKEAASNA